MARARLILAVACLGTPLGPSAYAGTMPPAWVQLETPPDQAQAMCALRRMDFWNVFTVVGGIGIETFEGPPSRQDVLPPGVAPTADSCSGTRQALSVTDGWLIACDAGEFGGGLWWVERGGGTRTLLLPEPVAFLLPDGDGALALSGFFCGNFDTGFAYRLRRPAKGSWTTTRIADLGSAPSAVVRETQDSFLVATWGGVWRVSRDSAQHLVSGLTWRPTSIVIHPDGTVYVGMAHFVLRFNVHDPEAVRWYAPQDCATFSDAGATGACRCSPRAH